MIKKLSQRVFFVIMISLSIVVLGIITLFAILNYNNTIHTAGLMMDRFTNGAVKKDINGKIKEEKELPKIDIEGLYEVQIENSRVIDNTDTSKDKTIEDYAIKASNKKRESGIIGNYIYRVRRLKGNTINVVLMENKEAILHTRIILLVSVIASLLSLVIIYIIAKKVSKIIVKPVEETFEKQKQFISDASHELKTPLAVIEANADVLENEIGTNKWMIYIQNEIESMDKLINELLLLAKIENTDNLKEYEQFDLSKEIEIILSMFESIAYEKDVKLISNIEKNITINGNKEDAKHILSTLIDNAIKHTEAQKEVIVEMNKEKDKIVIQVKNMGQAIPEEERQKIFERFYRIDKSRNRNDKRYGLGLAIAKTTIQKYNGNIEVDYKNGFTIFKVTLPK